ncbi:MAG: hypothetical protein JW837_04920 [Sedimentisphaerales bacterium]|nr:hypothetical protein [Sedimentisphaerales bacterium]
MNDMQNESGNSSFRTFSNCDNFVSEGFIDIHCHCLPGLDDGPSQMAQSLALCQALVDDGITAVVATPHQLGRYSGINEAEKIRETVLAVNEQLKNNNINLSVLAGADVRVDERICQLLDADKVLTLADGGKYILLELPHEIFIDIEPLLVELASKDISAIISHPERHTGLIKNPNTLHKWLEHSCYLQVTAGSLLGYFGTIARGYGWELLSSGLASIVATDSHNLTSRGPCMREAFKHIKEQLGERFAKLVCIENPTRILQGQLLNFNSVVNATYAL